MKMDFPVEQTIKERYSVRTYQTRPISEEDKEKLILYATHLGIGTCWLAATFNRSGGL